MTLNYRNFAGYITECDVLGPISADCDAEACFLPSLEFIFYLITHFETLHESLVLCSRQQGVGFIMHKTNSNHFRKHTCLRTE